MRDGNVMKQKKNKKTKQNKTKKKKKCMVVRERIRKSK